MVLSDTPIAWDFQRLRRTLESYRIDGNLIVDPASDKDRAELDQLVSWQDGLKAGPSMTRDLQRQIEPCSDVLVRTAGLRNVTDDNMGSEWLHFLGLE